MSLDIQDKMRIAGGTQFGSGPALYYGLANKPSNSDGEEGKHPVSPKSSPLAPATRRTLTHMPYILHSLTRDPLCYAAGALQVDPFRARNSEKGPAGQSSWVG
jgi:hypothetical protein